MGFKNIAGSVGNIQNQLTCKYNAVSKSVTGIIALCLVIGGSIWAHHAWTMKPVNSENVNKKVEKKVTDESFSYSEKTTSTNMSTKQQKIVSCVLIGFGILMLLGTIYSYFYTKDRCTFISKLTPKQRKSYLQGQGIATATSFLGSTIATTVQASKA